MRVFILICLLAGLVACSNADKPKLGLGLLKSGLARVNPKEDKPKPTADQIRASATPEALAKIGKPVMLGELPQAGLADIMIFVQQNGSYTTWASSSGISFIYDNGLLVGTRGMGFDLMTTDVEEPLNGISGKTREGVRVHRYLDGENQIVAIVFYCRYGRLESGVVSERCRSRKYEFENQYWVTSGGTIAKSRQWIGPKQGYLISERLI